VKRLIYIASIAALAATSCVERIANPIESVDGDKLVMESILSTDKPVQAAVAISYALGSVDNISFPESAEIELMGDGLQGSSLRFSYNSNSNQYVLRNQDFRPVEGGEYQVRAYVPDSDIDTILSSTMIPSKVNIASASYDNLEVQDANGANDFFFDLTIEIEESDIESRWLHIIPTFKTNTNPDFQKFQIFDPQTNKNAVSTFYLEEGVFVDMTKLNDNKFTIQVSTLIPVKAGTLIKNLFFETRSTTRDYFKYLQTRAKQKNIEDSGVSSPITDFTNIENGLGVFAGYNSTAHSIKF